VRRPDRTRVLQIALAMGVAVAFADSSIVVLALPDLYGEFDTTLVGVSWVISSYNAVVAVGALLLVPFARRLHPRPTGIVGVALFAAGSAGCASAWSLDVLIGFRLLQALGGTLLLAASLRGLTALTGSAVRGATYWTLAGTIGAAAGPALGGVLTQLFDWRAIFVVQVPLALVALAAMTDPRVRDLAPEARKGGERPHALAADTGLGLEVFGDDAATDEGAGQSRHRRVRQLETVAQIGPRRRPVDQQLPGDGELRGRQAGRPYRAC